MRKKKGLTQAKLAEQINVSNKAISRWETGEGYPEVSLLRPLAKALGTTVDDLLNDEEEEVQDEAEMRAEKEKESTSFKEKDEGKTKKKKASIVFGIPLPHLIKLQY